MPLVAANGLGRTHGTTFRVLSLRGRYTAEANLQDGEKRDCNLVGFGHKPKFRCPLLKVSFKGFYALRYFAPMPFRPCINVAKCW